MKRVLPVGLFALLLMWGCPQSSYHKAVIAEHDAKSVVMAFQQAELIEFRNGRISLEEHKAIEAQLENVGFAGQTLTKALQTNAPNQAVLVDLQALVQTVSDLGNSGVLGIKNETSKAALQAALAAIKAVLSNLQIILAAPTTETIGGGQ
jgi:hypothetical protein